MVATDSFPQCSQFNFLFVVGCLSHFNLSSNHFYHKLSMFFSPVLHSNLLPHLSQQWQQWYFVTKKCSDLLWENIVLSIEKNFKAEDREQNVQNSILMHIWECAPSFFFSLFSHIQDRELWINAMWLSEVFFHHICTLWTDSSFIMFYNVFTKQLGLKKLPKTCKGYQSLDFLFSINA